MAWYSGFSGLIESFSGIIRLGTRTSVDRQIGGTANEAREPITESTVLAITTAWACINLVAGTIATLPVMVYRPVAGGREVARDHWLYRILHDAPNADQSEVDFWEFMSASLELRGNAYAEKLRGASGQIVGLDPVPPRIMSTRRREDGEIEYRWTWNGKSHVETSANVLHIRGFGGDPLGGISPLSAGAEALGLARVQNRTASAVMRNAMRPSGVYQSDQPMKAEQVKEAEELLDRKYQGAANAGRPMVLAHGLKWEQLTMSPVDLEMIAAFGFSVEEICRIWGVPPHMVGHTAGNTQLGSSITEQTRGFNMFTLRRRLKRIESALRQQLLTPEDIAKGIIIEINIDGLLRGSPTERSTYYNAGLQNGWFTINEVRALENMAPVAGGDVPRMQMQNMPITMTGAPQQITAMTPAPAA